MFNDFDEHFHFKGNVLFGRFVICGDQF